MHTAVFILHLRLAAELNRASPSPYFIFPLLKSALSFYLKIYRLRRIRPPLPRLRERVSAAGEERKKTLSNASCPCSSDFYLIHALPRSERTQTKQNKTNKKNKWRNMTSQETNIYMYKVMYTIYSNTFQNRQTLKSLAKISIYFFSQPHLGNLLLSRLYNICIYE